MSIGWNVAIWVIVAVVFAVIEFATVQLVSIWFVIGSIPALISAALGASVPVQLLIFLITSAVVLMIIRPIAKSRLTPKNVATNADRVLGMEGMVLQDINNLLETGRVNANGLDWTARTRDNALLIPEGSKIVVLEIDGVKLIVAPAKESIK